MISILPEGARLALLNWPGGQPTAYQITEASGSDDVIRDSLAVVCPLLETKLIEDVVDNGIIRTFRLTQAGRKAVDVLQSGVE